MVNKSENNICIKCWDKKYKYPEIMKLKEQPTDICSVCRKPNNNGIYIRKENRK